MKFACGLVVNEANAWQKLAHFWKNELYCDKLSIQLCIENLPYI